MYIAQKRAYYFLFFYLLLTFHCEYYILTSNYTHFLLLSKTIKKGKDDYFIMKKEYDVLEMNVVRFENEDIVTASDLMSYDPKNFGDNDLSFTELTK